MDPINYVAQMNDPTGSVMAGYNQGLEQQAARQDMQVQQDQLGIQQDANARANEMQPYNIQGAQLGLEGQRQNMAAQAQQMAEQQRQIARRDQFRADMGALADLGAAATVQDFARIQTEYPELGQNVMQTFEAMDEPRQRNTASIIAQGAFALKNGNTEQAISLMTQYADAAEAGGDLAGAASARAVLDVAKTNPEAALASAGIALYAISPELAGKVFDMGESNEPAAFRALRLQAEAAGLQEGTPEYAQFMADGGGAPANFRSLQMQAEAAGYTEGTPEYAEFMATRGSGEQAYAKTTAENIADTETGADAAAAVAGGTKAGTEGVSLGLQAFESLGPIRDNIANIDAAITALDDGAQTGQLASRVPTWNAATLELRNLQNQLGLDVIGSVTFGALSEGELRLALGTALPTNMQEDDLRDWLVRKKDAQEKLMGYMEEQARFLARPGNTLDKWLDRIDSGQTQQPAPITQPATAAQPSPAAGATPGFLRFGGGN